MKVMKVMKSLYGIVQRRNNSMKKSPLEKNKIQKHHAKYISLKQFYMSLEDSGNDDKEILEFIKTNPNCQLPHNQDLTYDQFQKMLRRLFKLVISIDGTKLQLQEQSESLSSKVCELQQELSEYHLAVHELQEQNINLTKMMGDLQKKKDNELNEISFSQQEIKKSCLELQLELKNYDVVLTQLSQTESALNRKQQDNVTIRNELTTKNIEVKHLQGQISVFQRDFSQLNSTIEVRTQQIQKLKIQKQMILEENRILEQKIQQYEYVFSHNHLLRNSDDVIKDSSFEQNQNYTIEQANCEDDHEVMKMVERSNYKPVTILEDSQIEIPPFVLPLSSSSTMRRGGANIFKQPNSDRRNGKKEQRKEFSTSKKPIDEEKSWVLHSPSGLSQSLNKIFTQRMKVREQIDEKYEKDMSKLIRENFYYQDKCKSFQSKLLEARDEVAQCQGQLEMLQDETMRKISIKESQIESIAKILENERKRFRNYREDKIKQKVGFQEQILILKSDNVQLKDENNQLRYSFKKLAQKIEEEIQIQLDKHIIKIIKEDQKDLRSYHEPEFKKKVIKNYTKGKNLMFSPVFSLHFPFAKKLSENETQTDEGMYQPNITQNNLIISNNITANFHIHQGSSEPPLKGFLSAQTQTDFNKFLHSNFKICSKVHQNILQSQPWNFSFQDEMIKFLQEQKKLGKEYISGKIVENIENVEEKDDYNSEEEVIHSDSEHEESIETEKKQGSNIEINQICKKNANQSLQLFTENSQMIQRQEYPVEEMYSEIKETQSQLPTAQKEDKKERMSTISNESSNLMSPLNFRKEKREQLSHKVIKTSPDSHEDCSPIRYIEEVEPLEHILDLSKESDSNDQRMENSDERSLPYFRNNQSFLSPEQWSFFSKNFPTNVAVIPCEESSLLKEPNVIYICQVTNKQTRKEEKLGLWSFGLIDFTSKSHIVMNKQKKIVHDSQMSILGNCEVTVEGSSIRCRRGGKKKKYFQGNLQDNTWEVNRISTYKFQ